MQCIAHGHQALNLGSEMLASHAPILDLDRSNQII